MVLLADSTGLKQSNRGEWIRKKWKIRRGFVKLHMLADADTKKILAVVVTDDMTGDSPMLSKLLGTIAEPSELELESELLSESELESSELESELELSPQAEKARVKDDSHMALICQEPEEKIIESFLPVEPSAQLNALATGIPPLGLLCGSQPQTRGACLLADGQCLTSQHADVPGHGHPAACPHSDKVYCPGQRHGGRMGECGARTARR